MGSSSPYKVPPARFHRWCRACRARVYLRILGGLDFLSEGFVPTGRMWHVLFENVNVEGMRGRRRSGVDALGILHFVSGGYAPR